jgi:hypothetical protein
MISRLNGITIATLSFALIYLMIRHVRDRRAFWWWQEQQLAERYVESEVLRNQTLQSLFAVRRMIEQLPCEPNDAMDAMDAMDPVLETVHHCQRDLTNLSDRLCSAYYFENLPLALKELWSQLGDVDGAIGFEVQGTIEKRFIPEPYSSGQLMNYQLLLLWLRKFLQAGLMDLGLDLELDLGLKRVVIGVEANASRWNTQTIEITLQFQCHDRLSAQRLLDQSELQVIAQMFDRLMPGRCYVKQMDLEVRCILSWWLSDRSWINLIFFKGKYHE